MARVSAISPEMHLTGFNNTIDTLERAVKERVFFVKENGAFVEPPRPEPGHFSHTMRGVRERLLKVLPKAAPLSRSQFVETFRGRKKEVYSKAVESLMRESVTQRDAEVKVFVKYEKTDFTRKTDPVPRVISPRDPRYNVELGKYLRTIEERMFKSLALLFEGERTVFKGMNAADSGEAMRTLWNKFRQPVAIGLDASRFDQHVSLDALRWEHELYPHCFAHSRRGELKKLLRWQERNICRGYTEDGKLKYVKEGGRMSGDMNTSLGNCILMCSMIKAYSDARGVRTLLANNGDDCVVFMEADDLGRFSEGLDGWFRAMGFNMAVEEPCYQFEEIEFCQTHPVYVGPGPDSYIMVRHPKWAIAKDTMSTHGFQNEKQYLAWLDSVGTGGLSMTGGIPVFQDFYGGYVNTGKPGSLPQHVQSWGVRQLARNMARGYAEPLPATRASFYWAFGVTPDEQVVLEEFYRGMRLDTQWRDTLTYQADMPL